MNNGNTEVTSGSGPFWVKVWEVYERDTQRCAVYLHEKDARDSDMFNEVDVITSSHVLMDAEELEILKSGKPIYKS